MAGGNAVAAWVARVDETATRTTRDVDILLRRGDLDTASAALAAADFVHRRVSGLDVFLDGTTGSLREAVHVLFAGEKVVSSAEVANPDVSESEWADRFRILTLEALVRLKLSSYRDKDRVHLRDLIEVGLVDASWCRRYAPPLAERLQDLVDTPGR